tara:strand:+ start:744 stop:1406 length:663 start_codon:yes stop_codon:yes gene_type:complete
MKKSEFKAIKDSIFKSADGKHSYKIPYIYTPEISLVEDADMPTLTQDSMHDVKDHFDNLKASHLNKGGTGIIFGTFDNLHAGHKTMLSTASSVCDSLYIGIEDQQTALTRKNNKHPILPNEERLKGLRDFGITKPDHVFVRTRAIDAIKELEENGVNITTLIVGESQNDNPEMLEAVEYCLSKGMQVVATTRLQTKDKKFKISSSTLHKQGKARTEKPKR